MSEWQPIETAPKDGRPVWVRGNDWGEDAGPNHYGWAYFDSGKWMWPDCTPGYAPANQEE